MATEAIPAMHRNFARWYAPLTVADNPAQREARWATVHSLAKGADGAMVEALVRLAFGTRQAAAPATVSKINEQLKTHDELFEAKDAAREMQLLAGATLDVLFDRQDTMGGAAALSVLTASFIGARVPNLPMDIVALAETALDKLASANRTRPTFSTAFDPPKIDFTAIAKKVQTTQNWDAVAEAITSVGTEVRTATRSLAMRHSTTVSSLDRLLQIQDEELQMLWWVIGGRSHDLDTRFDQVASEAQPLIFGKELSDATAVLPGPSSIKSMLLHAGVKERKKVAIHEPLAAVDLEWLQDASVESNPSPVTCPIHFAIQRHVEAGGGDTWVSNWAAVAEVDGSRPIAALAFAMQFYRERLLTIFV